jgi:hypothetical protein
MALSPASTFARSFLRHRLARPVGAAVMALALGGAIAGGAMALSPTVDTALVFRGGVNIFFDLLEPGSDTHLVYTVPANRKFMLTDLVISNESDASPAAGQFVYTGTTAACSVVAAQRTGDLKVPAGGTLHLPFVTGIGFNAGLHVCIVNNDSADATNWTIRGYLFE